MAAKNPLTEDERETIATMLRGGSSYGQIVKATGRSTGSISRVAKDIGHHASQSSAARTRVARQARTAYSAEVRADHASKAQARIGDLLGTFHNEVTVAVSTPRGAEVITMKPTARDYRDRASAIQTLQRMVLDVMKADTQAEESPHTSLLVQFVSDLREAS